MVGLGDLEKPASRAREIAAGIIALLASVFFGYFGIRGAWAFAHGSRAAPGDPVAASIGIAVMIWGGFLAVRLIGGWNEERPLLPHTLLLIASVASVIAGLWFVALSRSLHESLVVQLRTSLIFFAVGVAGLGLWWRRIQHSRTR